MMAHLSGFDWYHVRILHNFTGEEAASHTAADHASMAMGCYAILRMSDEAVLR